jgi:hypothetical protein
MLFGVLILIAQPRVAPRRLVLPIAQHGIERHLRGCEKPRGEPAKP